MSNSAPPPRNDLPEHVHANRTYWDSSAPDWVRGGERAWQSESPYWGVWGLPESELKLLPDDMTGLHAIELGCGTGYVSGWMTRRGASVVAIDNSANQLATARRLAALHGARIEFLHGNAETVPLPDASFDFAFSEYGAAIWCDPHVWIPEAHRLLRPGGNLVFLGHSPLSQITIPPSGDMSEERLHRSYFDLHRLDWTDAEVDPGGVEFQLPISAWLRLFRETGLDVIDYLELQAPAGLEGNPYMSPSEWGKRWPYEHVWKLRRQR